MPSRSKLIDPIFLESYKNAGRLHEYYSSFRYRVLAYLATINAALFYFLFHEQPNLFIAIATIVVGVLSVVSLYLFDKRTCEVMEICIKASKDIEAIAGIPNDIGTFQQLIRRKRPWYSHKNMIKGIVFILLAIWFCLLFISIFYPDLLNLKIIKCCAT